MKEIKMSSFEAQSSSEPLSWFIEELDHVSKSIEQALKYVSNAHDLEIDTCANCAKAGRLIVATTDMGVGSILCPQLPSLLAWLRNPNVPNPKVSLGGLQIDLLRDQYCTASGISNDGYFRIWCHFIWPSLTNSFSRVFLQRNDQVSSEYRIRRYAADWLDACRVAVTKLRAAAANKAPAPTNGYLRLRG